MQADSQAARLTVWHSRHEWRALRANAEESVFLTVAVRQRAQQCLIVTLGRLVHDPVPGSLKSLVPSGRPQ